MYSPKVNYSTEELDAAALQDLRVDVECAERDGYSEYAAKYRALIAQYANTPGAHAAVLRAPL